MKGFSTVSVCSFFLVRFLETRSRFWYFSRLRFEVLLGHDEWNGSDVEE